MKVKYEVSVETGYDVMDGHSSYRTVKTFKGRQNEKNAISFIEDPRNLRVHGYMFLEMFDEDGNHFTWNEDRRVWEGDHRVGYREVQAASA